MTYADSVIDKNWWLYCWKNLSHREKVRQRREERDRQKRTLETLGRWAARMKDRVTYECLSGVN